MSTPTPKDLAERAKKAMQELPAETALGNADPAGGVATDPKPIDEAAAARPQQ